MKRTGPAPPARPGGHQGAGCPLLPNLPASSSRGLARRQPKQKDWDRAPGAPRAWGLGPLLAPGNESSVIAPKPRGDVWTPAGGGRAPASLEPTSCPTPRQGRLGPPAPRQDPATALPPGAGTAPPLPLTPALGRARHSAAGPNPGMPHLGREPAAADGVLGLSASLVRREPGSRAAQSPQPVM